METGVGNEPSRQNMGSLANLRARAWRPLNQYGLLLAFVGALGLFSVLKPDVFPTAQNAGSILTGSASLGLIALGVMLPLIVNQFDMTPGYVATLSGVVVVSLQQVNQWPAWEAVAIALLVSAAIGLVNGLLVSVTKLSSLIVTLGVGSLVFGVVEAYTSGKTYFVPIDSTFGSLGQGRILGLPLPFIYLAVVALIIWYVLEYRPTGRRLYAIGGSEEGARLIGIKVDRLTILMFIGSSLLAGFGGVVQAASTAAAGPTGLSALLLPAFTAAFLGATSIRPGHFNVWGTVIAVYLVGASTTGLFMLGASTYVSNLFNGAILLIAVGLARLSARRLSSV